MQKLTVGFRKKNNIELIKALGTVNGVLLCIPTDAARGKTVPYYTRLFDILYDL